MPDADTPAAILPAPAAPGRAPQIALAFDFGRRRIGVACGDTVTRAAHPLSPVPADGKEPAWPNIDSLVRDWQPNVLVVGLPYNVDGSDSAMSARARGFAADLQRRYSLPVCLVDERYSSLEAGARLQAERQSGRRRRRVAKADVDAAAACVILERWFFEVI